MTVKIDRVMEFVIELDPDEMRILTKFLGRLSTNQKTVSGLSKREDEVTSLMWDIMSVIMDNPCNVE